MLPQFVEAAEQKLVLRKGMQQVFTEEEKPKYLVYRNNTLQNTIPKRKVDLNSDENKKAMDAITEAKKKNLINLNKVNQLAFVDGFKGIK